MYEGLDWIVKASSISKGGVSFYEEDNTYHVWVFMGLFLWVPILSYFRYRLFKVGSSGLDDGSGKRTDSRRNSDLFNSVVDSKSM